MDLIRLLLLEAEGDQKPDLAAYSNEQIVYHKNLLIEAGLVAGAVSKNSVGYPTAAHVIRLTWAGHEFLDSARNEGIWRKAIARLGDIGSTVSVALLQEFLTKLLRQQLKLE